MQEDEEVLTAYRGAVAAWKSKPRSPPEMASPAHFASFMAAQQQMVDELAAEPVYPLHCILIPMASSEHSLRMGAIRQVEGRC